MASTINFDNQRLFSSSMSGKGYSPPVLAIAAWHRENYPHPNAKSC